MVDFPELFSILLSLPATISAIFDISNRMKTEKNKTNSSSTTDLSNDLIDSLDNNLICLGNIFQEFSRDFEFIIQWKEIHKNMTHFSNDGNLLFDIVNGEKVPSRFKEYCKQYERNNQGTVQDKIITGIRSFKMGHGSYNTLKSMSENERFKLIIDKLKDKSGNMEWWNYIIYLIDNIDAISKKEGELNQSDYKQIHENATELEIHINFMITESDHRIKESIDKLNQIIIQVSAKLNI